MCSCQLHYIKRKRFMPFLLAEMSNFQGSTHLYGVGSFSKIFLYWRVRIKDEYI